MLFPFSKRKLPPFLPVLRAVMSYHVLSLLMLPLLAGLALLWTPAHAGGAADTALAPDALQPRLDLLPLPAKYTLGNTLVCLSPSFRIEFDVADPRAVPDDLRRAAQRTAAALVASRHTYLSAQRGAEFFPLGPARACGPQNEVTALRLTFTDMVPIATHATAPVERRARAEAYKLHVPVRGAAQASGDTALGMFRALTTFENLVYHTDGSAAGGRAETAQAPLGPGSAQETEGRTYAPFAPYEIDDAPAFPWRAVLLDTSRHFFSKHTLLRTLDTMASAKLNVFHWHITDSDSWPFDLAAFPELAAQGAYGAHQRFSEADVREVVAHAAERGIDVVVELDTPGHTASIGASHPEYIACLGRLPWTGLANQPPAGQLRFADARVGAFAAELFRAAAPLVKSRYFGTGGDELNLRCYAEDAPTQAALQDRGLTIEQALRDFTAHTHDALREAGKTPVVWQEMTLDHGDMGLHEDTVVDVWTDSSVARSVLDKGFRIVHAAADYFYLDCGQGGWLAERGGGNSWCDPFKAWTRIYSFDPYHNVAPEQRKLVLGGQASLWAEQTDENNLESQMWPRAAALAELFWTGARDEGFPRDPVAALPRMLDVRERMVDKGVRAVPLQPEWCVRHPGVCVLNG